MGFPASAGRAHRKGWVVPFTSIAWWHDADGILGTHTFDESGRLQSDWHHAVMHTCHLSDTELKREHLRHTADVSKTVAEALGAQVGDARVCVLPEGPMSVPYFG